MSGDPSWDMYNAINTIRMARLDHDLKPRTLWRHFKGTLYMVESVSLDEPTLEPMVTYKAVDHEDEDWSWTRRMSVFLSMAEWPVGSGKFVPRFKREDA